MQVGIRHRLDDLIARERFIKSSLERLLDAFWQLWNRNNIHKVAKCVFVNSRIVLLERFKLIDRNVNEHTNFC